jgi:hypothetical protein
MTYHQVFVGEHAAFEKHRVMRLPGDFPDGTSNTILIVEGGTPVPWTKPEDLHYAADEPLPTIGGAFRDVFHAAMADGAVPTFEKTIDTEKLRALITRDGGEPIDLNRLQVPTSPRARQLQADNQALRGEIEQMHAVIADLRKQLSDLQKQRKAVAEDDAELVQLQNEKLVLQRTARELADQVEQFKKEIQDLKKERDKRRLRPERPD